MAAQQAKFITVEGGDGSGKSTLLGLVANYFKSKQVSCLYTREPGGTPVADEIREILLKPGRKLTPVGELLLFEAARAEHVATVIRPALARGTHVLCDRFTHSSLAFQGTARGLGEKLVADLNLLATQGLEPDAVVWLKLEPEKARARIDARGEKTRLDAEQAAFHHAVFAAFESMAARNPRQFIVLDASLSPDGIFESLLRHPNWIALFAEAGRGERS